MNKITFSFIFLFIAIASFGQSSVTFKGKVVDSTTKQAIESATVYVSLVKDSSVVNYTITDKYGKFEFRVKKIEKPIYLSISYITYEDSKINLEVISKDKDFGVIDLKEVTKTLNEVVIKSEAPPIRIKKDTLEFNVSSFKVRPDANVETLLKQLPGVEIDSEGKITVNGKEVNQILVNGKPFFDKDGKIALQNLPSDIIKKVQVTDTKTKKEEQTKQAASSNNASINLTIDEDKNKGFFGKVMTGYGSNKRYESSMLVNYFKNKLKISALASSNNINSIGFSMDEIFDNMGGGRNSNVWISDNGFSINGRYYGSGMGITQSNLVGLNYADEWTKNTETSGSYFYSNADNRNSNKFNQTNFLPSGNFTTISNSDTKNMNYGHNFKYQLQYKIDSTTTLTLEPKWSNGKEKRYASSYQKSLEGTNGLLNESNSETSDDNTIASFGNLLTFTRAFKKKGRYISLTFENTNNKTLQNSTNKSTTVFYHGTDPDDIRDQIKKVRSTADEYNAEIEYTEPIADSLKVNLGAVVNYVKKINTRDAFDYDAFATSYTVKNEVLTNYTGSFTKTVRPTAGFSLDKKKYDFYLNFGTAIMQFDNHSEYLGVLTDLNKNYLLPYASCYGSYKFSKNKNLWVNYEYEMAFPEASQVLPVEDLANPLNTYIGNPNLDLNKNHNFYLNYSNYDYTTRSGYGFYGGGNLYDNQVVSSTTYDANRKRTTTYDNVSGTYSSWFGVYFNRTIKKEANTYRFNISLGNNYSLSKGFTDSQLYEANRYSFAPRLNFTYEYGELFTINPSYNYAYSKTNYSNYVLSEASNFTHKLNLQITNYWPKNWTFGNDFGYTYNSNIANGYKKDFYLWNTSLAYSFFGKKLLAKVKVYDLLNQNQNATRTITPTTIRDEENIVLKRYVMFSLTYKLEKFAGKEKKESGRFRW